MTIPPTPRMHTWTLKDEHRPAVVQEIAKALCRHRHFPRSVEEAVAPGRELWMRYLPDAEIAAETFFRVLDALSVTSEKRPTCVADQPCPTCGQKVKF